jgi:hypothetical protein
MTIVEAVKKRGDFWREAFPFSLDGELLFGNIYYRNTDDGLKDSRTDYLRMRICTRHGRIWQSDL